MNQLIVGSDKTPILHLLRDKHRRPSHYLLIDDGAIIDALTFPKSWDVTLFDVSTCTFNPLHGIDYLRAQDFVSVIQKAIPGGPTTLTRDYSAIVMLDWLLNEKPKSLYHYPKPRKDVPGSGDASLKIQRLLLSPVLSRVLTQPMNFSFDGIVLVRLNRGELGDFDCLILGNLLASMYKGQVIIPDYGFYGHNTSLIREERLIAGVNYLSESELEKDLLRIPNKIASRCLPEDAEVLAQYEGKRPGTKGFADTVEFSIE